MNTEGKIGLTGLTYNDLLAVKSKVDQTFKFTLPGTDKELDIRDYNLREVDGMYILVRKEEPKFGYGFDSMGYFSSLSPEFHFAHYIWLKDCTKELARQLVEIYPHLESK